jgi:hypothetical protein
MEEYNGKDEGGANNQFPLCTVRISDDDRKYFDLLLSALGFAVEPYVFPPEREVVNIQV